MNSKRIAAAVIAMVLALGCSTALSRPVVELCSRYNGDGWFEYRVRTLEDPFFKEFSPTGVQPYLFTNYIASIPPVRWQNDFDRGNWYGMSFDYSITQPRINETTFYVRSSCTNFRREPEGFLVWAVVAFADCYLDGLTITTGCELDCLVPCASEAADGSLPELVSRAEKIPDIKIDNLVITNGGIYGVTFSWNEPSTFELQGSHNMTNWVTIARFFGDPPQTTWISDTPLNSFGEFFRLLLVANSHLASAQPSSTLSSALVKTRQLRE